MPRNRIDPKDELQDPSWRTQELGFEKIVPQSGPRAANTGTPDQKSTEPKRDRGLNVPRREKDR